jgi:hypothetical protein
VLKIVCRLVGGLGNQLFIYAAARRLAVANNAKLVIDSSSGFERDFAYNRFYQLSNFEIPNSIDIQKIRNSYFQRLLRYLKRLFNRLIPYRFRSYIFQSQDAYDPRLLQLVARNNIYLEGYWQSERYFKDIEAIIRQDLRIIPPTDHLNLMLSRIIKSSVSVAVHIRFFDSPEEPGCNNVSKAYYQKAISTIESVTTDARYFLFSDSPDAALDRVTFPEGRVTAINHNIGDEHAYADLWLMSLCQHFIIANSTFSWWGAWLSERQGKCVIAPAQRITGDKMTWGFEGHLPEEWIKL